MWHVSSCSGKSCCELLYSVTLLTLLYSKVCNHFNRHIDSVTEHKLDVRTSLNIDKCLSVSTAFGVTVLRAVRITHGHPPNRPSEWWVWLFVQLFSVFFVCLFACISQKPHDRTSVFLWLRIRMLGLWTLRCSFVDDVIFSHNGPSVCSVNDVITLNKAITDSRLRPRCATHYEYSLWGAKLGWNLGCHVYRILSPLNLN